ncbi:MAG: hypothetical protein ACREQR_08185 [Candidatus Binataceae bacterium]
MRVSSRRGISDLPRGDHPAVSIARRGLAHKAEQFSHEQTWQKPEQVLGTLQRRPNDEMAHFC